MFQKFPLDKINGTKNDSLTLKRHNSFQIKNTRKTRQSFGPRRLIFKLQQKFLKFNDIFVIFSQY